MRPSLLDVLACVLVAGIPLAGLWLVSGEILRLLGRIALALSGVP